jgi:hypothetical protein
MPCRSASREQSDRSVDQPSFASPALSSEPWQLRRIPPPAADFDAQDACIHASPLNVDVIALICQQHRLRRDDLQIVIYMTFG